MINNYIIDSLNWFSSFELISIEFYSNYYRYSLIDEFLFLIID